MHHDTHEKHGHTSSTLEDKVVFFFVAVGIITITLGFFALIDFLPEKPGEETATEETTPEPESDDIVEAPVSSEALPVKIIIDALDREVDVLNPTANTVEALDAALLSGVVRHPDSADFVNEGTIFLLGHSSYLPNVMNKNFQAFNGLQKLQWGDVIRLQSADLEYVYSVEKVYEVKASEAEVPLQFDEARLIIATCNSFGTKDDRFVVEAKLVMKRPLPSV